MPRLIDAYELKKHAYPFPCAVGVEYAVTISAINDAPTIDAVPVRNGYWFFENKDGSYLVCSVCRAQSPYKRNAWLHGWHETVEEAANAWNRRADG